MGTANVSSRVLLPKSFGCSTRAPEVGLVLPQTFVVIRGLFTMDVVGSYSAFSLFAFYTEQPLR